MIKYILAFFSYKIITKQRWAIS